MPAPFGASRRLGMAVGCGVDRENQDELSNVKTYSETILIQYKFQKVEENLGLYLQLEKSLLFAGMSGFHRKQSQLYRVPLTK